MQAVCSSRIGLLADIHYDGSASDMNRLYETVAAMNRSGIDDLVVMGDLIDSSSELGAIRLLKEVSALCNSFQNPIHYMPGNHDLDHISKDQFHNALGREDDPSRLYFEQGGYGFVCIDGNFSPDGTEYGHGNFQWQEAFIPPEQLEWLQARLVSAPIPMIVLSHQRIDKPGTHSVGNDAAVREVIHSSNKVKAVFQGHQHADDLQKIDGIPYYTLSAYKDGVGPAVVQFDEHGVRLFRDFQPDVLEVHAAG